MGRAVRRMSLMCGLPEDALSPGARVTMMGRGLVLVEGQNGVVELGASCVRLRTAQGVIAIRGEALELRELSADAAMVCGSRIDSADYGG